jgi:hypothetical protein
MHFDVKLLAQTGELVAQGAVASSCHHYRGFRRLRLPLGTGRGLVGYCG